MHRLCPECKKLGISLVRCLFADKSIRCTNCGASFNLKNTLLNKLNLGFWYVLMGSGILLLLLIFSWKLVAVLAIFSALYVPFHKANYGELKLSGLRARLKDEGVKIDSKKAENVRKKNT